MGPSRQRRVAERGRRWDGRPCRAAARLPADHLTWRHVAADLAADHTVICPDLRGYGASDKPAEASPQTYAKRTMGADVVALARALGHERFALAVREVEATLGRKAAPFGLTFTLLPVRDERIRPVGPAHYLVPERVYLGAGWPAWLRGVVAEVA